MPLRFRRDRPGVDQVVNPQFEQSAPVVHAAVTATRIQAAASDGPEQLPDRTHGGASKEPNSHEKKRVNWIRTEEESRCLQSLFTSDYEASKARNPDRVPGTCQWFLQSEKYKKWRDNQSSDLLWVTADPGCGKSVLSKSLIDSELQNTSSSTTCYFFFKDDSADQRSVAKAICALLHQFLCARKSPILLQKTTDVFRAHGSGMTESLYILWNLLLDIAQDPAAGQMICILDALDECEKKSRETLIRYLNAFSSRSARRSGQLKFLVTSRPYYNIEESFDHLTIRLAGEDESEAVQREIDLVIKDRVPRVSRQLRLDSVTQNVLQQRLLDTENRTYLWLHLILEDIVKRSFKVKTPQRMEKFLEMLPATVHDAYERILEQSPDHDDARKLLQIVLAAQRPLKLEEINIALHIQERDKTIEEVDLEQENSLPAYVKNLCGLFVTICDSRVYLLHQTAREFLLSQDDCSGTATTTSQYRGIWKHTFQLETCHSIMARICMTYLLFDVFEDEPLLLFEDGVVDEKSWYRMFEPCRKRMVEYNARHALFMYTLSFWPLHFRKCKAKDELSEMWLDVCDTESQRFRTWFHSYWQLSHWQLITITLPRSGILNREPPQLNGLMVASFFGHDTMIKQVFEKETADKLDDQSKTALWWAVLTRRISTVELLLDRGVNLSGDNKEITPLMVAAIEGFDELVALLVDAGASLECVNSAGFSALAYAVRFGHQSTVETLIGKGATIDTKLKADTLLCLAVPKIEIVKLLLAHGAAVNGTMEGGRSPLMIAVERGHEDIANLLIDAGANLEFRDVNGRSALACAAKFGKIKMTKLLLEKGAEINTKDQDGRTPLSLVAERGLPEYSEVLALLINAGAMTDTPDIDGMTPLSLAATYGSSENVALLLNASASIDTRDKLGRTPLIFAAQARSEESVRVLLKNAAKVNVKDKEGCAALCYAAYKTNDILKKLCAEVKNLPLRDLNTIEASIEIPSQKLIESAARSGHAALVAYLLKLQFEREPLPVTRRKLTLLEEIQELNYPIYLCYEIMAHREIMRMLVKHGADTETKDCEGCKSLWSKTTQDQS